MSKSVKKESGVSKRNKKFVQDLLDDIRSGEDVEHVYIARVVKKLGNGRVEVLFIKNDKPVVSQAVIRGSFRGKGKHSVWIDVGSIVAIAETGVVGAMGIEISAVLTADQTKIVAKEWDIDPRITNPTVSADSAVSSNKVEQEAFEFTGIEEHSSDEDVDVDNI